MTLATWLLTFSCYANWLPGDRRGYVTRAPGSASHKAPPNGWLCAWTERALRQPPFLLDAPARAVVDDAIRDQCIHAGWQLHAVHVRTNHVHVVVTGAAPPERIMRQLKAWATRRLREAARIDRDRRVWARHGSTVPLRDGDEVRAACRYVVEGQGGPLEGEA
ncbi:Hypothetical protein A7982_10574 [Minicystis rosea]|nr:Hypothetical protein A7982_10574 [Minicystis rosea]